ncbi:MAG TPA: BON domain-containing protein [Thermoanaerobaculia bacterium]
MANRYDDRGRMFGFDDERDRWRDDEEYRSRDWDRSNEELAAWDRDRAWHERDWDRGTQYRPEERRWGRWYGIGGRMEGVGSAAGYSGMGGPGWTSGGYGDPGYGTSGFGTSHYGTSRHGAGYDYAASREPMPMSRDGAREWEPGYGRYERSGARWGSGDYRIEHERDRETGPYSGRGPKGYQRSDERIREEVSERLTDDDRIDASGIELAVANGEVTLAGTVESRRMKRLAEDLAESVRGVRDVHNQLRVGEAKKQDHEMSLTPEAERLRKQTERKR